MCIDKHYAVLGAAEPWGPQGTDPEVKFCVYKLIEELKKQNCAERKDWFTREHCSWDGLGEVSQITARGQVLMPLK